MQWIARTNNWTIIQLKLNFKLKLWLVINFITGFIKQINVKHSFINEGFIRIIVNLNLRKK